MASRLELHNELKTLLGSENVYFQPPESFKMQYDCIVYKLNDISNDFANNKTYFYHKRYEVTLITKKADNDKVDAIIQHFPYCIFNRSFVNDNLYHHIFYIYY